MNALVSKKKSRLDMRLSEENKELLQRAALLLEQDLTSFVMSVALREANKIVDEYEVRLHSKQDQEKIFSLLMEPGEPNDKLKQAARRYKNLQLKHEEV